MTTQSIILNLNESHIEIIPKPYFIATLYVEEESKLSGYTETGLEGSGDTLFVALQNLHLELIAAKRIAIATELYTIMNLLGIL